MRHDLLLENSLIAMIAEQRAGLDPFPRVVEIHPTDACNQRCAYCFHGGVGAKLRNGRRHMSLGDYRTLFGELNVLGIRELSIAGGGEPTLSRDFAEIVESALAEALAVRVVTHGDFHRPGINTTLARTAEVRFSVDAVEDRTYSLIRGVSPGTLPRVTNHILALCEGRRFGSPRVGVSFLRCTANRDEEDAFCEYWLSTAVDEIILKEDVYDPTHGAVVLPQPADVSGSKLADARISRRAPETGPIQGRPCFAPSFKVTLNPYGELFSCCLAAQPGEVNGYRLGSLTDGTFAAAWATSRQLRLSIRDAVACTSCNWSDRRLNRQLDALLAVGVGTQSI